MKNNKPESLKTIAMKRRSELKLPKHESGATLIVALIMLLMTTLLVSGSFNLSTLNLKAVGNTQVREEALAAANAALEQVISSPFTANPSAAAEELAMDINNDSVSDYTVSIAAPQCTRATQSDSVAKSSASLTMPSTTWNTVWEIIANVTEASTGTSLTVRSAVRVRLSETQKNLVCL